MNQDNAKKNKSPVDNHLSQLMQLGINSTKIANQMAPVIRLNNNVAKLSAQTLKAFNSASQVIADSVRANVTPSENLSSLSEDFWESSRRNEERKRQAQAEAIAKANAEAFQSVFNDVLEKNNQNAEDMFKRTKKFQAWVAVITVISTIIGSAAVSYYFTNTSASPKEMSQQQVTSEQPLPIAPQDHESGPSKPENNLEQFPNTKIEEDISANASSLPTDHYQTSNTPKTK